jgi:tetratricopeptide (TPR) repeat protein
MSQRQSTDPSEAPARGPKRPAEGRRRIAFRLGAVLLGLAPFFLLEGTLTVFGVGGRDRGDDPMAGFGTFSPLFELDAAGDVYATARSRQKYFGRQQFARHKPERTFRIFGLGGSTVRGRPYETDTSFLKWLQIELNARDAARRYETVNCGGLSYASYRLTRILDEVLQYEPDLILIATGHNEFLEDRTYDSIKSRSAAANWALDRLCSLRTVRAARELYGDFESQTGGVDAGGSLDAEVNTRLDSLVGYASYHRDEQWRSEVIEQFERSVRGMVETCRQAGVPLVLVNLGENLRDCPPFKSEHKPGLSVQSLERFQEWFDKATRLDDGSPKEALNAYRAAESIDDQHALLSYRMARCFDRLGEMEQARRYYARAKDLDVCPLRMLDAMHERLKRIAADAGVPLFDARQLLADLSPDGIPGNDCFMDHVHPSIGMHQRIGRALAANLEEAGLVGVLRPWPDDERRAAYRRHFDELGPAYLANGGRRVQWLDNWSCRHRLDAEMVPKDARGHLRLGRQRLDFGQYDSAWEQFQLAMHDEPRLAKDVLDHALALCNEGRGNLAQEILDRLLDEPAAAELGPQIELASLVVAWDRGITRQVEGESPASVEGRSAEAGGHLPLGPLPSSRTTTGSGPLPAAGRQADRQRSAGDVRQTIRELDGAIRLDPNSPQLYAARARLYLAGRDLSAALVDATKAVRLSPDSPDGYKLRAAIYTMLGRFKPAVDDLTKANRLDPGDPNVLTVRGYAYQRLGEAAKAAADFKAAGRLGSSAE